MSKLQELIAQREALAAQINEARDQAQVEALAQISAIMEDAHMTADELIAHLNPKLAAKLNGNGHASVPKGSTVVPKYRDPATGQTWAGRGRKPTWMEAAIAQGKTAADFAIAPLQ